MSNSSTDSSLLRLEHGMIGYPGVDILKNVELSVSAKDYLLLAGANGSGKSTLMRTLLGALPLNQGHRYFAAAMRLGYVPQQMALDPSFPVSVADVVSMGLWGETPRPSRREIRQRKKVALAKVGMENRTQELFGRLSGGQKQRVLLARALVMNPNLLLLDEPVSGVDAQATEIILNILAQEVQSGTAVVLVSHQPIALRHYATRAVLVKEGLLKEIPVAEMCSAEGLERLWA